MEKLPKDMVSEKDCLYMSPQKTWPSWKQNPGTWEHLNRKNGKNWNKTNPSESKTYRTISHGLILSNSQKEKSVKKAEEICRR